MKDIVKNKVYETKNITNFHSNFQLGKQNLKNNSEVKYQNNDYYYNNSFNYLFNFCINPINVNIIIIMNHFDNIAQKLEPPYNETQRENMQIELQKEEEIDIKEEKTQKKETKISKKRKRCKPEERSENIKIYPKKMFDTYIEKENQIKIGNNTQKKSKRESNQLDMIKRNLIQNIFLYWINDGESDINKRLNKLDPIIFSGEDFKQKTLQEIYSQKITIKEIDKNHNIKIINKARGIKKMKLCLGFKDALKFFFNEYFEEKELLQIFQNLKEKNDISEEISYKGFLKGLKGAKEYLKERGGNEVYSKKLENSLKKFREKYLL